MLIFAQSKLQRLRHLQTQVLQNRFFHQLILKIEDMDKQQLKEKEKAKVIGLVPLHSAMSIWTMSVRSYAQNLCRNSSVNVPIHYEVRTG